MNKNQRLVLAIFVPIIILFIALMIAYYVSFEVVITPAYFKEPIRYKINKELSPQRQELLEKLNTIPGRVIPEKTVSYPCGIKWQKTWYVWLIFLIFCCIFEFLLFGDKKRKIKN